jgi:hypothetical protein
MLSVAGELGIVAGLAALLAFTVVWTIKVTRNRKMRIRSHRIAERLLNRE